MLDTYQVAEARAWGADCILIILAQIDDRIARDLASAARDWNMDAIAEVHDRSELDRALALDCRMIGINNRNLKTFEVSLATTEQLAPLDPEGPHRDRRERYLHAGRHCTAGQGWRWYFPGRRKPDASGGCHSGDPNAAEARRVSKLSHIDERGEARMIDVSDKATTSRTAIAEGFVGMLPATLALIESGEAKKGDVLATARIAGIMAAKKTHELIPLCHPLAITKALVDLELSHAPVGIRVRSEVRVTGQTGVEMEALTAVSVACLTIYDMLKAVDKGMVISDIRLLEKTGGRSGTYTAPPAV